MKIDKKIRTFHAILKPDISYFQIDYRRKLILSIKFDKKMWCFPRNIEARYSFYSGSRTGRNLFFPDFSSRKYIIIKYFRQKNKNFSDFEKTGKYILFEISKRGTFRLGRTFEKEYFSVHEKDKKIYSFRNIEKGTFSPRSCIRKRILFDARKDKKIY